MADRSNLSSLFETLAANMKHMEANQEKYRLQSERYGLACVRFRLQFSQTIAELRQLVTDEEIDTTDHEGPGMTEISENNVEVIVNNSRLCDSFDIAFESAFTNEMIEVDGESYIEENMVHGINPVDEKVEEHGFNTAAHVMLVSGCHLFDKMPEPVVHENDSAQKLVLDTMDEPLAGSLERVLILNAIEVFDDKSMGLMLVDNELDIGQLYNRSPEMQLSGAAQLGVLYVSDDYASPYCSNLVGRLCCLPLTIFQYGDNSKVTRAIQRESMGDFVLTQNIWPLPSIHHLGVTQFMVFDRGKVAYIGCFGGVRGLQCWWCIC